MCSEGESDHAASSPVHSHPKYHPIVPEISVTPPPRSPSPTSVHVELYPTNVEELNEKLVGLLDSGEWRQVWRLWVECKALLEEEQDRRVSHLDVDGRGGGIEDEEDMKREEEIQQILARYCNIVAKNKASKSILTRCFYIT